MRRAELEHVIAAAAEIVGEDEFVVIGSQAILGADPDPPEELLRSMEADLYPRRSPDKADAIEGALGDGSRFEQSFGYFAHAVGPETAKAPAEWEERLIRLVVTPRVTSRRAAVAWCLEPHDLVLAKLARGLPRDWEYARIALGAEVVDLGELLRRAPDLPLSAQQIAEITDALTAFAAGGDEVSRRPRRPRGARG